MLVICIFLCRICDNVYDQPGSAKAHAPGPEVCGEDGFVIGFRRHSHISQQLPTVDGQEGRADGVGCNSEEPSIVGTVNDETSIR